MLDARRRAAAERRPNAQELARGARALRALGRVRGSQRRVPRRGRAARPRMPRVNTGVGRAVPREVQQRRSAEVVSGGARGRSANCEPALLGVGAALADENPPQADAAALRGARDQSRRTSPRTCSWRARRSTPASATRRGSCSRRRWPSTRRASRRSARSRRSTYVEDKQAGVRGRGRQGRWPSRRTTARSTAWPASWPRTTTASTKRWRWSAEALTLEPRQPRGRWPTSASTCCAPATSRPRGRRSKRRSSSIRSTWSPTTCCR